MYSTFDSPRALKYWLDQKVIRPSTPRRNATKQKANASKGLSCIKFTQEIRERKGRNDFIYTN